ncbi:MAG: hypothetical protein PVG25_05900 [Anaerolineae bacterium]|jgi:hypothetical protein
MHQERPGYISYLMRLWRDDDECTLDPEDKRHHCGQVRIVWRASLESALSGKRRSFASLDALFTFLRRETGALCDGDTDDEPIQR